MSRQAALATAVICLVAVVAVGVPTLAQETQTVSDGESIQKALEDAAPGDTIQIESGTYQEHVNVTVPNVTLVGIGDNPVIEGTVSGTPVVNVTAPGVTIDSLTVTGGEGIGVIDEENRTVSGTGDGISAVRAAGLTIVDSHVVDNDGWGVNIRDSPDSAVVGSTLTNNVWDGAIFVGSNGSVARDNNASGNGIEEEQLRSRHGIRFTNTSHGTVENNTAVGNAYGGLLFTNPVTNSTIRNNTMRSNGDRGLGTFGAFRGNRVVNNTITDNDKFGVLTYVPGGNNTFVDNLVRDNGGTGIAIDDTDRNRIRNNTVVEQYVGIRAGASVGTSITNNTVRDGAFSGISVSQSERVLVRGNTVSDSGVGLLLTGDATGHVVADNVITTNDHGVAVQTPASNGTVVGYNDIIANDGYGAAVFEGAYHRENNSFSTIPPATADVPDLNATHNYWGTAGGPAATVPDGDSSNTVSPNVVFEPATEESRDAPESLGRAGHTSNGSDETDDGTDDGSDDTGGGDGTNGGGDDADDDGGNDGTNGGGDDADDEGSGSDGDRAGNGADDDGTNESADGGTDRTGAGDSGGDATDTASDSDSDTGPESSDGNGPGFGVLVGVAGIIAAIVVARQRC